MIRIRTILLLLLSSYLWSSCSKLLDIEPKNSITTKNGIKTEQEIRAILSNIESQIRPSFYFNRNYAISPINIVFSSYNHWISPSSSKTLGIETNISPRTEWNRYYKTIHLGNIILDFLDQTDMKDDRKDYYRGQVFFYKAFAYLGLIRTYGDVILITDDVILEPVAKTPWPIVADYAIELTDQAINLLPEYSQLKYNNQGDKPINKFTPSKGAANALLAELCSWKAGAQYTTQPENANYDINALWNKAEKACTDIIESGEYSLAINPEEVCESVLVGDSKESIFESDIRTFWDEIDDQTSADYSGILSSYYLSPKAQPSWSITTFVNRQEHFLVDSVRKYFSPNDLRKEAYFFKLDSLAPIPEYKGFAVPNKYRKVKLRTSGSNQGAVQGVFQNIVYWRLAQIYLLRAECRVRLNRTNEAISDLNTIRQRANAEPYSESEGDLRYAIFEEKCKKEMLMETETYWLDIIRNDYIKRELSAYGYGKLSVQDIIDGAMYNAIAYRDDFNQNPMLRQNTYWLKRFGW